MYRNHGRSRRGIQILVLVLCAAAVAGVCALIQAHRSDTLLGWTHWTVQDLILRDALASAADECWYEAMTAANQPGALYRALRTPGASAVTLGPKLDHSRFIFVEKGSIEAIAARVVFGPRAPLGVLPGHWRGTVAVEVTARARRSGAARQRLVQVRELRIDSLVAPVAPDALCGGPVAASAAPAALHDPAAWRAVASLVVAPAGPRRAQSELDLLLSLLTSVNGTVFVDSTAADPVRLRNVRFSGRGVLVVRGPLELTDVGPADPARDQLAVIALGDVSLGGTLELALVAGRASGAGPVVRKVAPDTRLRGALTVLEGTFPNEPSFRLDCAPDVHAGPAAGAPPRHDQLQAIVAPVLISSHVEVLP